jgi:hypothetical protein
MVANTWPTTTGARERGQWYEPCLVAASGMVAIPASWSDTLP